MSAPIKASRRLSGFNFEQDGAAVALVSKDQGGPANGRKAALIMKATSNFSEEFLEKAQKVQVTMELPDFLQKFFDMWYEDAQILSRMMGYVPEENDAIEVDSYEDYIERKLESFEILKSAYESESIAEVLSNLDEEKYMMLLRDQEMIEKAFKNMDSVKEEVEKSKSSEQPVVADTPKAKGKVIKAKEDNQTKTAVKAETKTEVNKMVDKSVQVEKTETVDMIEKSEYEIVNKALADKEELLTKAMAQLATYEVERKELLCKARKDALKDVLGSEDKVEELFKAVGELDVEKFDSVLAIVKSLKLASEEDDLFKETGSKSADEVVTKSALRAGLEAKYLK